jgi:hypothetical protein
MGLVDFIAIAAVALIIGGAVFYIIRAKKRGQKCIGCPYAKKCGSSCHCNTSSKNDVK